MRRDAQRLNDILESLDWIAKAVAGRTEADFVADETLCYAVAQKLTIIGEAVARLSPELTARHLVSSPGFADPWYDAWSFCLDRRFLLTGVVRRRAFAGRQGSPILGASLKSAKSRNSSKEKH